MFKVVVCHVKEVFLGLIPREFPQNVKAVAVSVEVSESHSPSRCSALGSHEDKIFRSPGLLSVTQGSLFGDEIIENPPYSGYG